MGGRLPQTLGLQNKPSHAGGNEEPRSSFIVLVSCSAVSRLSCTGSLLKVLSDSGCGWAVQEGSLLMCLVVEAAGTADRRTRMWLSLTPWLPPSVVAGFQDQLIPRERPNGGYTACNAQL